MKKLSTDPNCTVKNSKVYLSLTKTTMNEKDFYRAEELAEKLDVNIMTIYRYIKACKLRAYKIGKEFRIEKAEFKRFINSVKTK